MYTKLILATLCSLALAAPQHQQAAQYPAGVDPHACPGFPICDNARLHNPQPHWGAPAAPAWHQPAAHAWQQQPAANHWEQHHQQEDDGQYHHNSEWDRDTWSPHHEAAAAPAWNHWDQPAPAAHHHAPATAAADRFPAGVNPHSCPNYPYCDVNAGHNGHHAAAAPPPLPGWNERMYPAGVSPHTCPNFPYCH